MHHFFPDPTFGWTFYGVLLGISLLASYTDLRTMRVPKGITLTAMGLGVLFNIIRGAWLGSQDLAVWALGAHGVWLGGLDGFLFAFTGLVVCFILFVVLWILGTCGGGDVKLFAALGAWLGPWLPLWVLVGTLILIFLVTLVRFTWLLLTKGLNDTLKNYSMKKGPQKRGQTPLVSRRRIVTFAFPLAIVTALFVPWIFRVDLELAPPKQKPATALTPTHNA